MKKILFILSIFTIVIMASEPNPKKLECDILNNKLDVLIGNQNKFDIMDENKKDWEKILLNTEETKEVVNKYISKDCSSFKKGSFNLDKLRKKDLEFLEYLDNKIKLTKEIVAVKNKEF